MSQASSVPRRSGNAYNIFIFVLTVVSLVIMGVMFLPLGDETIRLLQFYDNLICVFFLIDFFIHLRAAPSKSGYFVKQRGWLDLLGSLPSFGVIFKYSGLLRLARLSRLARITRRLRRDGIKELLADVVRSRSNYAAGITILFTIIVLGSATVLVLQFEGQSPDAKIVTGWDAFWFSIVTITTVGYGDYYPVTYGGRITAIFVMITGVGIIASLASILSSLLLGSPPALPGEAAPAPPLAPAIEHELTGIRNELAALRQLLEKESGEGNKQESKETGQAAEQPPDRTLLGE